MELNPTTAKLIKEWALITSERLAKRYDGLKIGRSRGATGALRGELNSGWTMGQDQATFSHMYYGAFVDMGVGRGTKLGDVAFDRSARGTGQESSGRRPKRWYSPVMYNEMNRLGDLAQRLLGHKGQAAIVDQIPPRIEL